MPLTISCEDPELEITWYFPLPSTISFLLVPFRLIHLMVGNGIPLALHVKLAEELTLAITTEEL